jgi:phosphoglucomutase
MIDRVAAALDRRLRGGAGRLQVVRPGLIDGSSRFGGEESAGCVVPALDGTVWTTDKDGILLALLAAEILAVTGKSPSQHYAALTAAVRRTGCTPGWMPRPRASRRRC